jgi:ATP-dependent Clp endopeptidase proteolytic subunit ClpP
MDYKFFNVQESKDKKTATLYLYGEIGRWCEVNEKAVAQELNALEKEYKSIDVRINSPGGEVHTGLAIFNALRRSKAEITIHVDGLAASMGSVIASARRPLYMNKYSQIMVHSASIYLGGNKEKMKEAIKQLEAVEDILADIYSQRTGLTKEEIKKNYFDGKDHWITPEDALKLKLIDGIEDDTDEKSSGKLSARLHASSDLAGLSGLLTAPAAALTHDDIHSLKPTDMITDELNKKPAFAGKSEAEVLAHIATLEAAAVKVVDLEKKVADFEKAAADAKAAEITSLVDGAVKDGRIKEPQRATYLALLNANFEKAKEALDAIQPPKRVMDVIEQGGETKVSPWTARMNELAGRATQTK